MIIQIHMKRGKSVNAEIKGMKDLLERISSSSSKVFIIGHNDADFDSIASAIGLQSLCTFLGKEAYVIINDPAVLLDPGVKKIKDNNIFTHNIITIEEFEQIKEPSSTLIVTDTNNQNLVAVKEQLDEFNNIIIIDHHQVNEHTIKNAACYIDEKSSSASEIVAQLLITAKVNCDPMIYTYLLAGIVLDTGRFKKNTTSKTHDVVKRLINKKASSEYVSELFMADFNDDKKINDLVFNGSLFETYEYSLFQTHNVSFTLNREKPTTIYRKEQIAKAADRMLKYSVDAAFVMGFLDDYSVSVSARSKGVINVGKIMSAIGGGGNTQNAGAKIKDTPIEDIEELIRKNITCGIEVRTDEIFTGEDNNTPQTTIKQKVKV